MSMRSNACESSSSSSKHTHWTAKLRSMIRNMWSIPPPRPDPPTLSPLPEELPANILELEQSITWMRNGSPRLHESMFTMSCRASSNSNTAESIHRAKHGRSFSMDVQSSVQILRPLPPVTSSFLPVPESLLVNLSDLKRDKTPMSQGAGCAVYKAVHNPTGRLYALKVVYTGPEEGSVIRSQILQEFQVHREVANPNFVKCYDVFRRTGQVHVLLEFMDGGSLKGKHVHNEKALSDLARQVLTGLAYLHRRRVVHRDIKPANLLINTKNEEVKLADFVGRASAKTMDPWNSCVGNIAYMSPERINPDHSPGKHDAYAGDIWSFGVSILELYLGRYPFSVDRYQHGYWSLLSWAICMSEPPEAPPTASRELRHFIACCLQREPDKRFSAAKLLKHPFISGNGGGHTLRRQGHH